jgi:hypothetical protein
MVTSLCNRREDISQHNIGVADRASGRAVDRPKRRVLQVLRHLVSTIVIINALSPSSQAADKGAEKLKARLTHLLEIIPRPEVTGIDLFGVASPHHEIGEEPAPPFHVKGKS